MPDKPEPNDGEMEKLSRAIVEAILGSKDVKKALEKIHKLDEATAQNLMVFVLRLDSLSDLKSLDFADMLEQQEEEITTEDLDVEPERVRKRRIRRKPEVGDLVDGRRVSKSEKLFMDYLSQNFNSKDWLKKHGLSLDIED